MFEYSVSYLPNIQNAENHGIHEEWNVHHKSNNDTTYPVEEQHEEVICRPTIENAGFQSQRVIVEKVKIDQEVKSGLRGQRVEEQRSEGSPKMELMNKRFI